MEGLVQTPTQSLLINDPDHHEQQRHVCIMLQVLISMSSEEAFGEYIAEGKPTLFWSHGSHKSVIWVLFVLLLFEGLDAILELMKLVSQELQAGNLTSILDASTHFVAQVI